MKKLLLLILLLPTYVFAQNTVTLESGTSPVTPTFRYKPVTPDSLNHLWIYWNGKYNRLFTATEIGVKYAQIASLSNYWLKSDTTSTLASKAWAAKFVPYDNPTKNVNWGSKDLTVNKITTGTSGIGGNGGAFYNLSNGDLGFNGPGQFAAALQINTQTNVNNPNSNIIFGSGLGSGAFTRDFLAFNGTSRVLSWKGERILTTSDSTTLAKKIPADFVTPEMYGAIANGIFDCTSAINSAIATGKPVWFGNGNYLTTGNHQLNNFANILGLGTVSKISTTSNNPVFLIKGGSIDISNILISGDGKATGKTSQHGISLSGDGNLNVARFNVKISNVTGESFGGALYYCVGHVGSTRGSAMVVNCFVRNSNYGFFCDVRGEYNTFVNCTATTSNNIGFANYAGNNSWMGGQITDNSTNVLLSTGGSSSNDGHAQIVGAKINHGSVLNIKVDSLYLGYLFSDCMIYAGSNSINNAAGIKFSNCEFEMATRTFNIISSNGTNFSDCKWVNANPTFNLTGTTSIYSNNNFFSSGITPTGFNNVAVVPGGGVSVTTSGGAGTANQALFANGTIGAVPLGSAVSGVLLGANGGTGVANTGKTITVSGNTTIGTSTNTVALATTGNTSITLPTSGTLATLAGTETLTNKTITAPKITGSPALTNIANGTAGTDSLLVKNGTTNIIGKIPASYYASAASVASGYVDLTTTQTVGGAKSWTNAQTFNGQANFNGANTHNNVSSVYYGVSSSQLSIGGGGGAGPGIGFSSAFSTLRPYISWGDTGSMYGITLNPPDALTNNRTIKLPDATGTVDLGFKIRLTGSGTGAATTISIPHGLTGVTSSSICLVQPINAASAGVSYITTDATNVNIVYTVAPASGTNNLSYNVSIKP